MKSSYQRCDHCDNFHVFVEMCNATCHHVTTLQLNFRQKTVSKPELRVFLLFIKDTVHRLLSENS